MATGVEKPVEDTEALVTRLAESDLVPWYRKRNLRNLYLILVPTCIGVEMTSGCVDDYF